MNSKFGERVTLIVNSCDSYSDLWPIFFSCLRKYWPEFNCEVILNTEFKTYQDPNLRITFPAKRSARYGSRTINCIKSVKTDYVLFVCDDYFLRDYVNMTLLEKVINYLDSSSRNVCFRLLGNEQFDPLFMKPSCYEEFYEFRKYVEYKLNFKCAIWRKDFLLSSWKKHMDPWNWESQGTYRYLSEKHRFFVLKSSYSSPIDYGYQLSYFGLVHGLWCVGNVDDFFKREGFVVEYGKRGVYPDDDRPQKNSKARSELSLLKTIGLFHYALIFLERIYISVRRRRDPRFPSNYILYRAQLLSKKSRK